MTKEQKLEGIKRFLALIPHCQLLGMAVEKVEKDQLTFSLEGDSRFVGNSTKNLIHGGLLTVLMDTACGSAALLALSEPEVCPTIDLRLDHYQAAIAGKKVYCRAWTTHLARQIVFTEGVIWQDDPSKPIAKGTGTFMRLGVERTPPGFVEHLFGQERGGQA